MQVMGQGHALLQLRVLQRLQMLALQGLGQLAAGRFHAHLQLAVEAPHLVHLPYQLAAQQQHQQADHQHAAERRPVARHLPAVQYRIEVVQRHQGQQQPDAGEQDMRQIARPFARKPGMDLELQPIDQEHRRRALPHQAEALACMLGRHQAGDGSADEGQQPQKALHPGQLLRTKAECENAHAQHIAEQGNKAEAAAGQ